MSPPWSEIPSIAEQEGVAALAVQDTPHLNRIAADDVERQMVAQDDDPVARGGKPPVFRNETGHRKGSKAAQYPPCLVEPAVRLRRAVAPDVRDHPQEIELRPSEIDETLAHCARLRSKAIIASWPMPASPLAASASASPSFS